MSENFKALQLLDKLISKLELDIQANEQTTITKPKI